jgi:uncharacterized membrane protein
MWTCSEIRQAARSRIKLSLWPVILVTLVYTAIVSSLPMINAVIVFVTQYSNMLDPERMTEFVTVMPIISMTSSFLNMTVLVLLFLVFNPMLVGYVRYLGSIEKESADIGQDVKSLFWAFREGRYSGVVSGTSWKQLWLLIWSWAASAIITIPATILFVIMIVDFFSGNMFRGNYSDFIDVISNGIGNRLLLWFIIWLVFGVVFGIATGIVLLNRKYTYLFTEYVLAERTDMPAKAALDLSKQMSHGLKMKLFVLDLSFIGWYILSAITFGILQFWLFPYHTSAYLEVYNRRKAELGIIMNPPVQQMGQMQQPGQIQQPGQPYGNGA